MMSVLVIDNEWFDEISAPVISVQVCTRQHSERLS